MWLVKDTALQLSFFKLGEGQTRRCFKQLPVAFPQDKRIDIGGAPMLEMQLL